MNYSNQATEGKYAAGAQFTAVQSPQHPIPAALAALGTSIHEMSAAAEMLSNRLGVVLMPSPPETKGSAEKLATAPSPTSQYADDIHHLRRRVEITTQQLQDVLNRLEV